MKISAFFFSFCVSLSLVSDLDIARNLKKKVLVVLMKENVSCQ